MDIKGFLMPDWWKVALFLVLPGVAYMCGTGQDEACRYAPVPMLAYVPASVSQLIEGTPSRMTTITLAIVSAAGAYLAACLIKSSMDRMIEKRLEGDGK